MSFPFRARQPGDQDIKDGAQPMKTVIHSGCLFAQPAAQLRLVESEYHLCHDLRWISWRQPSIGDGIFHELTDTFDDRQTPLLEPGAWTPSVKNVSSRSR